MALNRALMVIGLILVASLLAEGDAQQKDQKTSADVKQARPESHGGGWGGGGWGGGGWGGGRGGGWGGGGRGGGWGGGGWGGGGHGGGWGGGGWGGGGCRYSCGYGRCCSPQEIAKIEEAMNTERMTVEVKPEAAVGKEGYGSGGYGGGGHGGYGGGGHGGGWGGGGGGGCRRCGYGRCCTPAELAKIEEIEAMNTGRMTEVEPEAAVGTQGYGGGGYGGGGYGGGGHGGGGWGGGGHGGGWGGGGGCRWCGRGRCCTPAELAELSRSESEAKGTETKTEAMEVDPKSVKQGEVKN